MFKLTKRFVISGLNTASSLTRKCKNKSDSFCYVCGCYILLRQRRHIILFVKRIYKAYFLIPFNDQDKNRSSHIVCHNYEEMLRDWNKVFDFYSNKPVLLMNDYPDYVIEKAIARKFKEFISPTLHKVKKFPVYLHFPWLETTSVELENKIRASVENACLQ